MAAKRAVPLLVLLAAVSPGPAQDAGPEGPSLTVYPAFYLKFGGGGSKNYLLGNVALVNVSGHDLRQVTLRQEFPPQLRPSAPAEGSHEFQLRPEGFEEHVEGAAYVLTVPVLRRREILQGFVALAYDGRPSEAVLPAAEVAYSQAGEPRTARGPTLRLELSKYTKYSGTLADFLKRFAGIQVRIPEGAGFDWGFSSLASRARARTPTGIVEVEGDAAEGRFSLLSGPPGETREVLVSWRPAAKAKPADTPEQVRKLVGDQVAAAADFAFDLEGATIERGPISRAEGWILATRWKDRVAGRLGEGPAQWYVYTDPEKRAQYLILLRAQGRGAGPGKSDVPNPDKEAALMADLETFAKTFRPL